MRSSGDKACFFAISDALIHCLLGFEPCISNSKCMGFAAFVVKPLYLNK